MRACTERCSPHPCTAMSKAKAEIIRFCLLLLGGLVGAGLAVGYTYLSWERYKHAPHDSFQRMAIAFQACIIFILAVYNVGYLGMKFFKLEDQAEEIRSNRKWHGLALNALLLFLFLMIYVFES